MELQILKLKKPILKIKLKKYKNVSGKNNSGKITINHKGGGHKKRYREISFKFSSSFLGIVFSIEYDPNRNCNIASIFNIKLKTFFYLIAAKNLTVGDIVKSGFYAENKIGHTMTLQKIPIGCCIFNVTLQKNNLAKISRSAGTYSIILEKTQTQAIILLASGKKKIVPINCFATIGIVSKHLNFLNQIKKAGKSRWLNKRPSVRGVAKNPVDHPNGGGEGKKSGFRKTPWGKVMGSFKKLNG